MVLLGFVTIMIYGVAYHVLPRFSEHPLHGRGAAVWHWWVANVGLALMVLGLVTRALDVRVGGAALGTPLLATCGVLSALVAYTFAYLIWRTIDGPASLRAAAGRVRQATEGARAGRLPLAEAPRVTATSRG